MSATTLGLQRWRIALLDAAWRERIAWAAPLLPVWLSMLVLGIVLVPEVTIAVPSLNDDAAHYSLILNASRAIEAGQNPVDHWAPGLEIGFPQFAYYQHLPHLFVVALDRLLLRQVELLTLFNLTRYGLLVGFPLTVYWSLRQLEFSRPAAGAAAALAPLLSAGHKFGFEYDSYVWRGFGMYTQLWAMHLTFLSLALAHRTLRDGKGYLPSVLALSALTLSHVIYAFITGVILGFLLLAGLTRANGRQRVTRLALVAVPALIATSYFWLPFLLNGAWHTTSPYMQDWKYNSHGAEQIMTWLVRGELFDYNRPPVITGFAAFGVLAALWLRTRIALLSLAVFGFWLVAYFGRPTLGPVADVLSFDGKLWMHRFIGPVQIGAILLVAVGATGAWNLLHRLRDHIAARRASRSAPISPSPPASVLSRAEGGRGPGGGIAPAVFTVIVLALTIAALTERWLYFDKNTQWMQETEAALAADTELQGIVDTIETLPPGRVYAGIRSGFSDDIKVGSLRIPDVLTFYQVETAAPPYQSLSLNSDLVWHFNHNDRTHYEVLNARYVILPASLEAADFLTPITETERYQLLEAPSGGYFGLAETPIGFVGPEEEYHVAARAWFLSRLPERNVYPALAIPEAPRLEGIDYQPMSEATRTYPHLHAEHASNAFGDIEEIESGPFAYEATVHVEEASTLFLKQSFHPDWHVWVDGEEIDPFMVSPSYPAIRLQPGDYEVLFAYQANAARTPLLALGIVTLGLVAVAERKRGAIVNRLRALRR